MFDSIKTLLTTPSGMQVDFTQPKGAEALTPMDGISWEIFANPISLYIGGITAVLLELAEPSVGSGVWDHSNFKQDTFGRLQRTGHAAMITVFAPKADAERMIARVVKIHDRIRGTNYLGEDYHANDPVLLDWVQSTAIFGFTEAYHHYVRPLTTHEKDLAFIEGQASAKLYGSYNTPTSWNAWEKLSEQKKSSLQDSQILADFIHTMQTAPILPPPFKPLQKMLIKAAIEISPPHIKQFKSVQGLKLNFAEKLALKSIAKLTKKFPMQFMPPAQAKQRLS